MGIAKGQDWWQERRRAQPVKVITRMDRKVVKR